VVQITGKVQVVDPDVARVLNPDGVSSVCQNFGNYQVADNDVTLLVNTETNSLESCTREM